MPFINPGNGLSGPAVGGIEGIPGMEGIEGKFGILMPSMSPAMPSKHSRIFPSNPTAAPVFAAVKSSGFFALWPIENEATRILSNSASGDEVPACTNALPRLFSSKSSSFSGSDWV